MLWYTCPVWLFAVASRGHQFHRSYVEAANIAWHQCAFLWGVAASRVITWPPWVTPQWKARFAYQASKHHGPRANGCLLLMQRHQVEMCARAAGNGLP